MSLISDLSVLPSPEDYENHSPFVLSAWEFYIITTTKFKFKIKNKLIKIPVLM
jgi:hypothetical protein